MPYDKKTEDRALARLMADIERSPGKQYQGTAGIPLCLALLMFILGLFVLLACGCNTIAGAAADIEAAARGTQQYLAEPVDTYPTRQ